MIEDSCLMALADTVDLVCDVGSAMTKCGYAGDDAPRSVFPTVVGRPKTERSMRSGGDTSIRVGDDAIAKRGMLRLNHPIRRGVVVNWPDMSDMYHHMFYQELRVDPAVSRVLLTETGNSPHENREKIAAMMFETFEVHRLFVANQNLLSLYASGRTTGCTLECGDGSTQVTPIYDGYLQRHAVMRVDMAGDDLTRYLQRLLMEVGRPLITTAEYDIVRSIKERVCRVATDFEAETKSFLPTAKEDFELPDGSVLHIGDRCLQCPEALFQPDRIGCDVPSLHELTHECLERCDIDIQRELVGNVILSGGSTMFPGLPERLANELTAVSPDSFRVKVCAPPERQYSVWIGGSILASLTTTEPQWISKADYDESGAAVLHSRCGQ